MMKPNCAYSTHYGVIVFLLGAVFTWGAFAPAPAHAQDEPSPFRVARYQLDVELQPEFHQLRTQARLTVVADEALATLTFHLNRNLKVEQILAADGASLPFEQPPQSDTLSVNLPDPLAAGQRTDLTVGYVGTLDPALKPERGPQLAAVSPQGSYLLPASRWFPQAENVWNRFAMELAVTTPEGVTALSSGRAEAPAPAGAGRVRTVFHVDEPTLAGTLVAGQFEKLATTMGAPVTFYLLTVPDTEARTNAETLVDIITYFSDTFGALKDPELAVVEMPDDTWEAYSAPGLLLLPRRQWTSPINSRLLARYVARQWWAGRTSPATAADAFMAVALARYSEALYAEHSVGEAGLRTVLEDLTIGALVDESAAPIANANRLAAYSASFNSVVRDKGAMVLHMLRLVIGDQNFFRLLQDYARRFAGRAATLDEFERLAEEVSGEPLDYFFGQWVRSTGIPSFEVDWVIYRTQEGFKVAGELKHELEIFRMPIPVRVETEGPPVTQLVETAGPSSPFSIETFGKPTRIQIDPNFDVLKYTPDLLLRVAIARGEALFERGQYFEATREYNKALEVKQNSSLAHYRMGEAFFAQRNYQASANAFREATRGDGEPQWTLVWSHIFLGKIFDLTGQRERAINEYRHALDTNDDTQGALDEARKYLQEPYKRPSRTIKPIEQEPAPVEP
jgi:aminopeptidase N